MISVPFWKVESVGNDFVLIHLKDVEQRLGSQSVDDFLRNFSIQASERHFGIGSDGLLAVGMQGGRLIDRMFNPDGTEDFCGNGLRCAAVHARSQGWIRDAVEIVHGGRIVPVAFRGNEVETIIGRASYEPQDVPVRFLTDPERTYRRPAIWQDRNLSLMGSALTTGSTHVVLIVPELPSDELFFKASREIENDPQFPNRTSVIWAKRQSAREIAIRIWERGAGETQGCGTGSSAAAVETMRDQNAGGEVTIHNPGGTLIVSARAWDAPITVSGGAMEVFQGEFLFRPDLA